MLSSFFITRPKFAIVIAVAIVIAGLVSLAIIPISQYPNLVPPTINITTTYPGADAVVILTEWKAFKSPDFGALKESLTTPLIFDGRNLYEPDALLELGIEYHAIGRQHALRNAPAKVGTNGLPITANAADAVEVGQ